MIAVPEYSLSARVLHRGDMTLWRASCVRDGTPVLVKTLSGEQGERAAGARLRTEFELGAAVQADGLLRYVRLVGEPSVSAIVHEQFDGAVLSAEIPTGGFELSAGLSLALQLAEALEAIHASSLRHGDIAPGSVLYSRATGAAKLVSVGAADPLPPNLTYAAPEQTGRTSGGLDDRSDLYSLGATLYHVFCGRPPFAMEDPLELVHSHLARMPDDPRAVQPKIPSALSDVVLKLLAKQPQERYQSARGLATDLRECLARLRGTGRIDAFALGRHEGLPVLTLSGRLYGREREVATLKGALKRVQDGGVELLIVSGYSGAGKSALVEQLRAPTIETKGVFLAGKFEQLGGRVPHAAIRQAFGALAQHLLSLEEARLIAWREKLIAALAGQGQVLLDVIPDLERVLGPQPPVEPLGPQEAQYRFARVFQQFIGALAGADQPLVLFLDDWQWADEASVRLIEALLTGRRLGGLLVVGAYRSNELPSDHPVAALLTRLRERGVPVREIALAPLGAQDVAALLGDALAKGGEEVGELAAELHRRTDGNPFYLGAFLRELCERRVIARSADGRWQWDLQRFSRTPPPDNVVALIAGRLTRFPARTQDILGIAACLGSRFSRDVLCRAAAISRDELPGLIAPALDTAVLIEDGTDLRFLHDRVQEAAYSLIARGTEAQVQLAIGRRLLEWLDHANETELLLQAVQHVNAGLQLVHDARERLSFARANLRAGRLARRSTAYRAAARCAQAGMELVGEDGWTADYETTLGVFELRAESEYLSGNFALAESLYPRALQAARTDLDRIRVLNVQKDQYELQGRYLDALATLRRGLRLVGITFPDDEASLRALLADELAEMPVNLGARRIADLVDAPALRDPLLAATLKMLMGMWPSCYVAGLQSLLAVVSVKIANFSLKHGNCEITSAAYVNYSFVAGFLTGDYETAYQYGKVGTALAERYPERSVRAWCAFLFGCGTLIWRRPLREGRAHLEDALELGVASGNIACASYAASYIVTDSFMRGLPLAEVRDLHARHFPFLAQSNPAIHLFGELGTQALREMTGMPAFDEQAFLERHAGAQFFMAVYLFGKLMGAYHFARPDAVDLAGRALDSVPRLLAGTFKVPETLFYAALVFLRAATGPQDELVGRAEAALGDLAALARHCDDNLAHKARLVEAELARVRGAHDLAAQGYEEAAALARKSGFIHDEALAYELAAGFWSARGLARLAEASASDAARAYARWGAAAKVRWIEQRFPAAARSGSREPLVGEGLSAEGALDLLSVTKASQAISSEIDFDRLLERLIRIVGENAGARRAMLFLREQGEIVHAVTAELGEVPAVRREAVAAASSDAPQVIVNHVARTGEPLLLADAARDSPFAGDPYIAARSTRSLLCMPVRHKDSFIGVLYLENDLSSGVFTSERSRVLELLVGQVAISLENARLYAELKESKDRLSGVFRQTLAGMAQTDLTGRFIEVNARYCEIVGRSAEELYGLRMQDVTHAEDLPRNLAMFGPMIEGKGQPFTIEKRYVRPDGEAVWVSNSVSLIHDAQGRPKYTVAVSLDITDRRRAEASLARQNERVRLLWEAAAVLLTTSEPDAMLRELFAKIREPLGLDLYFNYIVDEDAGCLKLVSCAGISDGEARSIARLQYGQAVCGNVALRRAPIVATHIQESAEPMVQLAKAYGVRAYAGNPLLAGGQLLGTLSFASRKRDQFGRDEIEFLQTVAHYVTVAYERLKFIEQLRHQDRRKDEFLATLAHELRNPLAPIRNGLHLLGLAGGDTVALEQARPMMERQVTHMVRLIDDLLDVSRISRNKLELRKEWVDIAAVVRAAVETSRPLIDEAGHRLETELPARPVLLDADPIRLAQAFSNLLNNAAKFTPRGGTIRLSVRPEARDVVVCVADNGIGIPREQLTRIFDMFAQGSERSGLPHGGLGIGLTLVQRLVQMHGGTVEARSDGPGQGSEIIVRLPTVVVERRVTPPAVEPARGRAQVRRRVLIVDDNRDAADSLAMMLKYLGHEVATAHEGAGAVRLAGQFQPDIALLDLGMPEMDGYDAARRIRGLHKDAIVLVAVTGWGQEQDRRRSREAGFDFHLVKPVEPAALEKIIAGERP